MLGGGALLPAGPASVPTAPLRSVAPAAPAAGPLAGRVIVIDPGHQLGNHNYPRQINPPGPGRRVPQALQHHRHGYERRLPGGDLRDPGGQALRDRLRRLGAEVRMTRTRNRQDLWGPCVDDRGRAGNRAPADLKVSIHGDGSTVSGARGFHVIRPTSRAGWTDDISRPSRRLALAVRAGLRDRGLRVANYTAGGDGLDARGDLGTLNLSDVPTVMVELGNMRNARDARRMTSDRGRATYAAGLARVCGASWAEQQTHLLPNCWHSWRRDGQPQGEYRLVRAQVPAARPCRRDGARSR